MTTGRKFSDDEYALCPEELPAGMIDFIRRIVLPRDNTLLYQRENVKGRCFLCGATVRTTRERSFIQGNATQCPVCGRVVICALETGLHYRSHTVDNVVAAQKGTDGETVFFRQFRLSRDISGEWRNIESYLTEIARYAIRGKQIAKWQKETKFSTFRHAERGPLQNWERWNNNRIYDNGFYFFGESAKEAVAGTVMQYADLEGYMATAGTQLNHIYFLEFHARFPVIEFLWKNGYREIVHEKILGYGTRKVSNAIRWQQTKLQNCFKFPMRFLKVLPPERWTLEKVAKMNRLWERRKEKLKEAEAKIVLEMEIELHEIEAALDHASIQKILNYIKKQTTRRTVKFAAEHPGANLNISALTDKTTAATFRDYTEECRQLHLDLSQKEILFPRDLDTAHERTMVQIKFKENEESKKEFRKIAEGLKKYAWQTDALLIRAAESPAELSAEGKVLHHCVGGYADRMAKGETSIFLIRKMNEQDKPFYTLELKDTRVVQCRTTHNKSYELEPEVKAFVDTWMQEVVLKGGKKKKMNKEGAV